MDPKKSEEASGPLQGPPTPRWVKVVVIAALVVVAVVVAVMVAGGEHGPSRHLPGNGDRTHQAPPGGHD